jgi:hypothetical protein
MTLKSGSGAVTARRPVRYTAVGVDFRSSSGEP